MTSWSLNVSYHKKHEYILFRGGDLKGFKDIRAKESVEPGHASSSALESGISNFKLSYKTICQYLSCPKNAEKSFLWCKIVQTKFWWFWVHPQASLRDRHFETLLHNFSNIPAIFQNFRTISQVVAQNTSGKILA